MSHPPVDVDASSQGQSVDDTDRGWAGSGADIEPDSDTWLREQRPPHWG